MLEAAAYFVRSGIGPEALEEARADLQREKNITNSPLNTQTGEITGSGTVITAKYVLPDGEGFVQGYQRPFNHVALRMTEILYAKSSNSQSGSVM